MSGEQRRMGDAQGPGPTAQQEYRMRLCEDYYEEVWRYFARYVGCPEDVEDLAQTVFLNLMADSGDVESPRRYVHAVARHQLYTYWRQRRAGLDIQRIISTSQGSCAVKGAEGDRDWDPLGLLSSKEIQQVIGSMITLLSPALAEALRLRFIDGLQPDEAAVRAGCSREALKKRIKRAERSLTVHADMSGA